MIYNDFYKIQENNTQFQIEAQHKQIHYVPPGKPWGVDWSLSLGGNGHY